MYRYFFAEIEKHIDADRSFLIQGKARVEIRLFDNLNKTF
jgi:hypothetical protein